VKGRYSRRLKSVTSDRKPDWPTRSLDAYLLHEHFYQTSSKFDLMRLNTASALGFFKDSLTNKNKKKNKDE